MKRIHCGLMKIVMLIMLFALPGIGFAQLLTLPVDSVTKKVSFSSVITIGNTSKEELYNRAKIWYVNAFRDSKEVIQLDDKENGIIMGKGAFTITYPFDALGLVYSSDRIRFTIAVRVKDNKYKIELTDMTSRTEPSKYDLSPAENPLEIYNDVKVNKRKPFQKAIALMISNSESMINGMKTEMASSKLKPLDDF